MQNAEISFVALLLRHAEVRIREAVDDDEIGSFFLSAGRYFQASWDELEGLHGSGLPLDDVPVALHVACHSGVSSEEVAARRLGGASWRDVLDHYYVSPATIHVPLSNPSLLPVSKPYHYYRRAAREAWKPLKLTDQDIVNLINVKFISEFYRFPAEKIVALVSAGWSFVAIHHESHRRQLAAVPGRLARQTNSHNN